jgi:hypothetical protein
LLPHTLIYHYCDDGVALEEGYFLAVCVPVHYVDLEFARELQDGGGGGEAGTRLAEVRGSDCICRTRDVKKRSRQYKSEGREKGRERERERE